jgi:K+-transporting ATPase KdpF subunit
MIATLFIITAKTGVVNFTFGYVTGAVISFFILGYLVYSLIKPEKF